VHFVDYASSEIMASGHSCKCLGFNRCTLEFVLSSQPQLRYRSFGSASSPNYGLEVLKGKHGPPALVSHGLGFQWVHAECCLQ
jgi:hypothetical protein